MLAAIELNRKKMQAIPASYYEGRELKNSVARLKEPTKHFQDV